VADETTGTETGTETETETTEAGPDTTPDNGSDAGAGDATVLGGDSADTAGGEAAKAVPDNYELAPVEGIAIDDESLELAAPVFKELGLDNDQANKLMPVAAEFAKKAGAAAIAKHQLDQAQAFGTLTREWAENAKGDKEIGGANWDKTVELSSKALDFLGFPKGSEFRKALNESGFGNHPEFIRAFRRIGERVSEDAFERGGSAPSGKVDRLSALYPDDVPKSEGA
jgi:hypothetical protein